MARCALTQLNILAAALAVAAPLRTAGQVGTGSVSPEQNASGQTATTRCVRKGTSQAGWMNEASPGASFGECQAMWLFDFPARVSLCAFHLR